MSAVALKLHGDAVWYAGLGIARLHALPPAPCFGSAVADHAVSLQPRVTAGFLTSRVPPTAIVCADRTRIVRPGVAPAGTTVLL